MDNHIILKLYTIRNLAVNFHIFLLFHLKFLTDPYILWNLKNTECVNRQKVTSIFYPSWKHKTEFLQGVKRLTHPQLSRLKTCQCHSAQFQSYFALCIKAHVIQQTNFLSVNYFNFIKEEKQRIQWTFSFIQSDNIKQKIYKNENKTNL